MNKQISCKHAFKNINSILNHNICSTLTELKWGLAESLLNSWNYDLTTFYLYCQSKQNKKTLET